MRVHRNDQLVVLRGKDRGKQGRVLEVDVKSGRVIVESINIVKRQETCQRLALIHFRHPGRIGSIIHVAAVLCSIGFARFKRVSLVANARASRAELM